MIHNEEAVNALERVAAEERGVAAERGNLAADLTAGRDQMTDEARAIGGMVEWWKARYPGAPATLELTKAHEWAIAQLKDLTVRIAEVAKEQQAHEIAAAALTEDAARARAEWEAQRRADTGGQDRTPADGRLVANGDRATKANPVLPRMDLDNFDHIDIFGAVWDLAALYDDGTGRVWKWDGRVAPGRTGGTVPIMRSQDEARIAVNLDVLAEERGPLVPQAKPLPNGVAPIDRRSAEVTAVDGAEK